MNLNTQIISIAIFILSSFIAVIGFFLKANWGEIKESTKENSKKLDNLLLLFTEMKGEHATSKRDIDIIEKDLKEMKKELREIWEHLPKKKETRN